MKNKKRIIIISFISILLFISIIVILSQHEYKGRNVKRVEKGCTYIIAATGEELKEGTKLPKPANGDIYKTKEYEYKYVANFAKNEYGGISSYYSAYQHIISLSYDRSQGDEIKIQYPLEGISGWEHSTTDKEKETYEDIAGSIAGEPIIHISFWDCTKMKKSPSIPKSVVVLFNTYRGCENLVKSPKIPKRVQILINTYWGCKKLTKAPKIPNGVIVMFGTFGECTKLKSMPKIPDSVRIMSSTFEGCTSLKKTEKLPSDVINISSIFEGCTSLKKAPIIPDGVYNMERAFFKCTNLKKVKRVPSSVRKMAHAFSYCESLTGTIKIETKEAHVLSCFNQVNFEEQRLKLKGDKEFVERLLGTNKAR
ncbi:MAG: leucine-rich repeat domain-containing protein [Lachnospiraceae bacterium]|nr:leucine-rich repeat domain-containing protein [Lachnospiraceae bacterium]